MLRVLLVFAPTDIKKALGYLPNAFNSGRGDRI